MPDYTIIYRTANIHGPGLTRRAHTIVNAPSANAAIKMFHRFMNGEIQECREARASDTYERVSYIGEDN